MAKDNNPKPQKATWKPVDPRKYFTDTEDKAIEKDLQQAQNELLSGYSKEISKGSLMNFAQTPEQIAAMTPEQKALYQKTLGITGDAMRQAFQNSLANFTYTPPEIPIGQLPRRADVYGESFADTPEKTVARLTELGVPEDISKNLSWNKAQQIAAEMEKRRAGQFTANMPFTSPENFKPDTNAVLPSFTQGTDKPEGLLPQSVFDEAAKRELDIQQQTDLLDKYRGAGTIGSRYADATLRGLSNAVTSGFGWWDPKDAIDLLEKPINMLDDFITSKARVKPQEKPVKFKAELPAGMQPRYMNGGETALNLLANMIPDVYVGLGVSGKIVAPITERLTTKIATSKTFGEALGWVEKTLGRKTAEYVASKLPEIVQTTATFELPTFARGITGILAGNKDFKELGIDALRSGVMGVAFGGSPFRNLPEYKLARDYSTKYGNMWLSAVKSDPAASKTILKAGNDLMAGKISANEFRVIMETESNIIAKSNLNGFKQIAGEMEKNLLKKLSRLDKAQVIYNAVIPPLADQLTNIALGNDFDIKEFAKSGAINIMFGLFHRGGLKQAYKDSMETLKNAGIREAAMNDKAKTDAQNYADREAWRQERRREAGMDVDGQMKKLMPPAENVQNTEGGKPVISKEPTIDDLLSETERLRNKNIPSVESTGAGDVVIVPEKTDAETPPADIDAEIQNTLNIIKNNLTPEVNNGQMQGQGQGNEEITQPEEETGVIPDNTAGILPDKDMTNEIKIPDPLKEALANYKGSNLGGTDGGKEKKAEVVKQAQTTEGKAYTKSKVEKIEKNEDGTITVYRSGRMNEGHNPVTTNKEMAKIISKERKEQGLSSDIIEVNINPEDVSVYVEGVEGELFVEVNKENKERIDKNTKTIYDSGIKYEDLEKEIQSEEESIKKLKEDKEQGNLPKGIEKNFDKIINQKTIRLNNLKNQLNTKVKPNNEPVKDKEYVTVSWQGAKGFVAEEKAGTPFYAVTNKKTGAIELEFNEAHPKSRAAYDKDMLSRIFTDPDNAIYGEPIQPAKNPVLKLVDGAWQIAEKGAIKITAKVPVMITNKMKQDLKDLGYTDEDISAMTPADANGIIENKEKKKTAIKKYRDSFKEKNAPIIDWVDDRGIERKSYDKSAYTSDYMFKSDDTGKNVRWGVELSDGRVVSMESAIKITMPDMYDKLKEEGLLSANAKSRYAQFNLLPEELQKEILDSVPYEELALLLEYNKNNNANYEVVFEQWAADNSSPLQDLFNFSGTNKKGEVNINQELLRRFDAAEKKLKLGSYKNKKITSAKTPEEKKDAEDILNNLINGTGNDDNETDNVDNTNISDRYKVVEIKTADISTNVDKFQNRDEEFSQDSVNSIVKAIEDGTFDFRKFDPVRLWRDPKDNKLYVLAGHSRLKAFETAATKGLKKFETIPAIVMEGLSEKEAMDYAKKESNVLGTNESLVARAKIYRDMRKEGKSETEILKEAKKLEKKNAMDVYYLSFLKPNGSMVQLYKTLDAASSEVRAKIQKMASVIGRARKEFTGLTDSHEEEIYAWLNKKKDFGYDDLRTKLVFLEEGSWDFDYTQPLNLEGKPESTQEAEYRQEIARLKREIKAAEDDLEKTREELALRKKADPKLPDDRINEALDKRRAKITALQNELIDFTGKLDKYLDAAKDQEALFSPAGEWLAPAPVFYSQLEKIATDKIGNNATPEQIKNTLLNNGVKPAEYEWLGLDEFMAGKDKVSKKELMDFIAQNRVKIEIDIFGDKKYYSYEELPEDLRKIIDKFDLADPNSVAYVSEEMNKRGFGIDFDIDNGIRSIYKKYIKPAKYARYTLESGENYKEILFTIPDLKAIYQSQHFTEQNIALHLRMQDFETADYGKILLIEELQSDWAQKGRKEGYEIPINTEGWTAQIGSKGVNADIYTVYDSQGNKLYGSPIASSEKEAIQLQAKMMQKGKIPDMPFKKNWQEVGMKWAIRYAAENGYNGIAWTTGETQAERYDLSQVIENIDVERIKYSYFRNEPVDPPVYNLNIKFKRQLNKVELLDKKAEELENIVGKEIAQKIIERTDDRFSFKGLDLKVGGEGMKGFYDKIIPDFMNKYTKKWGGKVETLQFNSGKFEKVLKPQKEWENEEWLYMRDSDGNMTLIEDPEELEEAIGWGDDIFKYRDNIQNAHFVPVTELMKKDVVFKGQPLFSPTNDWNDPHVKNLPAIIEQLIRMEHYKIGDVATQLKNRKLEKVLPYLPVAYRDFINSADISVAIKNEVSNEEEIRNWEEAYNRGFSEDGNTGDSRPDIPDGSAVNPTDRRSLYGKRPTLQYYDEGNIPTPEREYVPVDRFTSANGQPALDEHQRFAINLAINRFKNGGRAFLLGDGMGVGKTREILGLAKYWIDDSRKPVLIVAPNNTVIEKSFKKDAKAMRVPLSMFELGTYEDLTRGKIGTEEYGLVIFDEAQKLKNEDSLRAIAGASVKYDHVMFTTGTPMDNPKAATYYLSQITDTPIAEILDMIGLYYVEEDGKRILKANEGIFESDIIRNIIQLRNRAIRNGAMIRREYPFWGDIIERVYQPSDPDFYAKQNDIYNYWQSKIQRMARTNFADRFKIIEAYGKARANELLRLTEFYKLNIAFDFVAENLSRGEKALVVAQGINPTEIKSINYNLQGFFTELTKKLERAGIPFSRVYGGQAKRNVKEIGEFQEDKTDTILITPESGGAGIDLDDQIYSKKRNMLLVNTGFSGDVFEQVIRRISRKNTTSPSSVTIAYIEGSRSDDRKREILGKKIRISRAMVQGVDIDTLTDAERIFNRDRELFSPTEEWIKEIGTEREKAGLDENMNRVFYAVHNLTPEKLLFAARMGGLAMPSIAITKEGIKFDKYGSISLIAPKSLIDPKNTPVFSRDIYSPTYPRIYRYINNKELSKFEDDIMEMYFNVNKDVFNGLYELIDNIKKGYYSPAVLSEVNAFKAYYLEKTGQLPPLMMKDKGLYKLTTFDGHKEFFKEIIGKYPELTKGYDRANQDIQKEQAKKFYKEWINKYLEATYKDKRTRRYEMKTWDKIIENNYGFATMDSILRDINTLAGNEQELDTYAYREQIDNIVAAQKEKFDKFANDTFSKILGAEYIYQGKKKIPHTLDNAIMVMGSSLKGAEKTIVQGLGKSATKSAKRFKSVEEIKANADKLVQNDIFRQKEQLLSDAFHKLNIEGYYKYPNAMFDKIDDKSRVIGEVAKTSRMTDEQIYRALSKYGFYGVPEEKYDEIREVARMMRNMPTQYFEAKKEHSVGLNEFTAAVVPNNIESAVVDVLKKAGLKIEYYNPAVPENRQEVTENALRRDNMMFSPTDDWQIKAGEKFKGAFGNGMGNPYEYLKILKDYRERIKDKYLKTNEYKYARELMLTVEKEKEVYKLLKQYREKYPERQYRQEETLFGDAAKNEIQDITPEQIQKTELEIKQLIREGIDKNGLREQGDSEQLAIFSSIARDFAEYEMDLSNRQLGRLDSNRLGDGTDLQARGEMPPPEKTDTGRGDGDTLASESKRKVAFDENYLKRTEELLRNGGISFEGIKVKTPEDLAYATQVLRDTRMERFSIFYYDKDGKVLGTRIYTSRLPGVVFLPETYELYDTIRRDMQRLGAVMIDLAHNHSTGNPIASKQDILKTQRLMEMLPVRYHVINNHGKYAVIKRDILGRSVNLEYGWSGDEQFKYSKIYDLKIDKSIPNFDMRLETKKESYLGKKISPAELPMLAKELQIGTGFLTLVGVDPEFRTTIFMDIPTSMADDYVKFQNFLRDEAYATGSVSFIVAAGKDSNVNARAYRNITALVEQSRLLDFIDNSNMLFQTGSMRADTGNYGYQMEYKQGTMFGEKAETESWMTGGEKWNTFEGTLQDYIANLREAMLSFITGKHGTVYDILKSIEGRFSTKYVGTGEGVQAFGWGLYFSDLISIARTYADSMQQEKSKIKSDTEKIRKGIDLENTELNYLRKYIDAANNVLKAYQERIKGFSADNPEDIKEIMKTIELGGSAMFKNDNGEILTYVEKGLTADLKMLSKFSDFTADKFSLTQEGKIFSDNLNDLSFDYNNFEKEYLARLGIQNFNDYYKLSGEDDTDISIKQAAFSFTSNGELTNLYRSPLKSKIVKEFWKKYRDKYSNMEIVLDNEHIFSNDEYKAKLHNDGTLYLYINGKKEQKLSDMFLLNPDFNFGQVIADIEKRKLNGFILVNKSSWDYWQSPRLENTNTRFISNEEAVETFKKHISNYNFDKNELYDFNLFDSRAYETFKAIISVYNGSDRIGSVYASLIHNTVERANRVNLFRKPYNFNEEYKEALVYSAIDEIQSAEMDKDTAKENVTKEYINSLKAAADLRKKIDMAKDDTGKKIIEYEVIAKEFEAATYLNISKIIEKLEVEKPLRRIYDVKIGSELKDLVFLDWDLPVPDEQIEALRAQAEKDKLTGIIDYLTEQETGETKNSAFKRFTRDQGGTIYRAIENYFKTNDWDLKLNKRADRLASEFMSRAGIDIIRYPAEMLARGTTRDTAKGFNYVVIDDKMIQIINETIFSPTSEWNKSMPAKIDVDGVNRPTTNSSGKPIADSEEKIRNFWRWFGDSKAVDEQGRPLVVYHGTNNTFDEFKDNSWFSESAIDAETYTKFASNNESPNIMPVYLSIQNPLDIIKLKLNGNKITAAKEIDNREFDKILKKLNINVPYEIRADIFDLGDVDDYKQEIIGIQFHQILDSEYFRGYLKENGYDGIAVVEKGFDGEQINYSSFNSTQIKSAIGNIGTFDGNKESTIYSPTGEWGAGQIVLPERAQDDFYEKNKDLIVKVATLYIYKNPEITQGELKAMLTAEFERQAIPFKLSDSMMDEVYGKAAARYTENTVRKQSAKRNKMEERRFEKRFKASDEQSEKVKAELRNEYYKKIGNQQTADEALKLIDEYGIDGTISKIITNDPEIDGRVKVAATIIISLRNKAEEEALTQAGKVLAAQKIADKTADLVDWVAENLGTISGQTIQAFSLLNKLTPAGWIRKLKKTMIPAEEGDIERINQTTDQLIEGILQLSAEEVNNLIAALRDEKAELIKQLFAAQAEIEGMQGNILSEAEKEEMFAEYKAEINKLKNQFEEAIGQKNNENEILKAAIDEYKSMLQKAEWTLKELQARVKEYEDKDKAASIIETIQGMLEDSTNQLVNQIKDFDGSPEDLKNKARELKNTIAKLQDAAKRLSRKVIQSLKPRKAEAPDEVQLMVRTLWQVAQENGLVPEAEPLTKTKLIEIVGNAVKMDGDYKEVWEQAQKIVKKKLAENPEAIKRLEEYFNHYLENPFSDKEIASVVKTGVKELELNITEIVKRHYSIAETSKASLLTKLMTEAGLDAETAPETIKAVNKFIQALDAKWEELTEEKRVKILENIFKERKGKAKELYQKITELSNLGALDRDAFKSLVASKLKIKVITPEIANEVRKRANKLQELPEGSVQQKEAITDLLNYIKTQQGIKMTEIGWALWYASILSGVSTQIKNAVENAFKTIDGLSSRNPKEIPQAISGLIRGIAMGFTEAKSTMQGKIPRHLSKGKYEKSNVLELVEFKGGKLNPLNYAKYVGRTLKAVDVLLYYGNQEAEAEAMAYAMAKKKKLKGKALYDEMAKILNLTENMIADAKAQTKAEGLIGNEAIRRVNQLLEDGRLEDIKNESERYGLYSTFNNRPTGVAGAIARGIQAIQAQKAGKWTQIIVPFTNIVANVYNMSWYFTPAGIFRGIYGRYHGFYNDKGGRDYYSNREMTRDIISGLKGMLMFMVLGMLMFTEDENGQPLIEITATGMVDGKKRRQLMEKGWKPYSVRIFGRYIPYDYISPVLIPMLALGIIQDNIRYRKDNDDIGIWSRVETTVLLTMASVLDKSFMGNVADLFRALDPNREKATEAYISDLALRTASSVMPNFVKQLKYVWDPNIYQANTFLEKFIRNIGVLQNTAGLKQQRNILGDPVITDWNRVFVYTGSKAKDDPVWNWIINNGAWIPTPDREMLIWDAKLGKDRQMTDEEYDQYILLSGQEIKRSISGNLDVLNRLTQDEKRAARDEIVKTARDNAYLKMTGRENKIKQYNLNVIDKMTDNLQEKIRTNIRAEQPEKNKIVKTELESKINTGLLSEKETKETKKLLDNWEKYNKLQQTLYKIDEAIANVGITKNDGKPYTYMLTDREKEIMELDWKRVGNRFSKEYQYRDAKGKLQDTMYGELMRDYKKGKISKEDAIAKRERIFKAREELLKVKKNLQ